MTALVDTSILIDALRGDDRAVRLLVDEAGRERLHGSEITRLEVLVGMRPSEEVATRALLGAVDWHPVDADVSERAGALGRRWRRSHSGIDAADLAIAATAQRLHARLLTRNVRHFPMIDGLTPPY